MNAGNRLCLGFGEREGTCPNPAGSPWSKFWCERCDQERIAHISASMDKISAGFKEPRP